MALRKGILHGILAYGLWGLFPIFWKQLIHVDTYQIIAHRIVWSFVFLVLVYRILKPAKGEPWLPKAPVLRLYALASLLIGVNWGLYVWAVNSERIVESSLGYFINPLFSVLLGLLFFKEEIRFLQGLALGLAGAGVIILSFAVGQVPWIALALAISFGLYGAVKKMAVLHPIHGLSLETGLLVLPAIGFLLLTEYYGEGSFLHINLKTDFLLICGGLITTSPLIFFASAARKIPLSTLGFLQYLSPSLQFLVGILVYHEPFSFYRWIGFSLVWLALAIYAADGILRKKQKPAF